MYVLAHTSHPPTYYQRLDAILDRLPWLLCSEIARPDRPFPDGRPSDAIDYLSHHIEAWELGMWQRAYQSLRTTIDRYSIATGRITAARRHMARAAEQSYRLWPASRAEIARQKRELSAILGHPLP